MTDDVIGRAVEMMKDHWGEGDSLTEESYLAFAEKLAAAGLLAAPEAPAVHRRWRDRQGDVWLEAPVTMRLLRLVEFKGQTHEGAVQEFADVEANYGPLVLVPGQRVDLPAAPADDEATIEKAARAMFADDLRRGSDAGVLPWTPDRVEEHWTRFLLPERRDRYVSNARAALAALRGEKP